MEILILFLIWGILFILFLLVNKTKWSCKFLGWHNGKIIENSKMYCSKCGLPVEPCDYQGNYAPSAECDKNISKMIKEKKEK